MNQPIVILLVSGKRKSGKDYICEKVQSVLGEDNSVIIRISEPIKKHYANQNNLCLQELMSDSAYKEKYRIDMIHWSDDIRKNDPGYFCDSACSAAPKKLVWIVSDIRRKTDIKWFKDTFKDKIKTVRIHVTDEIRRSRGWEFQSGVDDVQSECDLDNWQEWDLKLSNNSHKDAEESVDKIVAFIRLISSFS